MKQVKILCTVLVSICMFNVLVASKPNVATLSAQQLHQLQQVRHARQVAAREQRKESVLLQHMQEAKRLAEKRKSLVTTIAQKDEGARVDELKRHEQEEARKNGKLAQKLTRTEAKEAHKVQKEAARLERERQQQAVLAQRNAKKTKPDKHHASTAQDPVAEISDLLALDADPQELQQKINALKARLVEQQAKLDGFGEQLLSKMNVKAEDASLQGASVEQLAEQVSQAQNNIDKDALQLALNEELKKYAPSKKEAKLRQKSKRELRVEAQLQKREERKNSWAMQEAARVRELYGETERIIAERDLQVAMQEEKRHLKMAAKLLAKEQSKQTALVHAQAQDSFKYAMDQKEIIAAKLRELQALEEMDRANREKLAPKPTGNEQVLELERQIQALRDRQQSLTSTETVRQPAPVVVSGGGSSPALEEARQKFMTMQKHIEEQQRVFEQYRAELALKAVEEKRRAEAEAARVFAEAKKRAEQMQQLTAARERARQEAARLLAEADDQEKQTQRLTQEHAEAEAYASQILSQAQAQERETMALATGKPVPAAAKSEQEATTDISGLQRQLEALKQQLKQQEQLAHQN